MGPPDGAAVKASAMKWRLVVAMTMVATAMIALFLVVLFMVAWQLAAETRRDQVDLAASQLQVLIATCSLIVTTLLAGITGHYAWTTRRMVGEMREARLQELELRRREKSETAATRALDAIHESGISMSDMPRNPTSEADAALVLSRQLARYGPLIADLDVADRVRAASQAALVYGRDSETEWLDRDRGLASVRLRQLIERTRWSIEAYLAERSLPAWDEMPRSLGAFAWIMGPSQ